MLAEKRQNSFVSGNPEGTLPDYTRSLLGFQLLNAVNFTIALGTPMVLLAKFLGAGESMIGILIALTPLFNILQLPAATIAERWGYKKLMLAGWRTRTYLLFFICPLPFLVGKVPSPILVAVMFLVMLGFNISRGFASGSWLPWLMNIIPEKIRGTYFGVENRTINTGVLITLLGSSLFLGTSAKGYQYGLMTALAAIAGILSLKFIHSSPGGEPLKGAKDIGIFSIFTHVSRVWHYKPFMKIIILASLYSFSISAIPGFLIVYLKDRFSIADNLIMLVSAVSTAGSLVMAPVLGRLSDRFGSRPLMRIGITASCILLLFWLLVGLGYLPANILIVAMAYFVWGVASTSYGIPLIRFVFESCPEGRANVGLSVFQVITSMFNGGAPVLWGFLIEFIHSHSTFDPFIAMFASSLTMLIAANVYLSSLKEPAATRTVTLIGKLLIKWPAKLIAGFRPEGLGEN
ncbi:MAG: MFS transporter [Kiritimatiellae bacterium]|nr:MFS transporter [Kiritimatiellia bacterium]MDD5521221.1 MFS transporter [Kiritimatiellia bacterium]